MKNVTLITTILGLILLGCEDKKSDDEVASLHNTALIVLENLGIRVLLSEARGIYSQG